MSVLKCSAALLPAQYGQAQDHSAAGGGPLRAVRGIILPSQVPRGRPLCATGQAGGHMSGGGAAQPEEPMLGAIEETHDGATLYRFRHVLPGEERPREADKRVISFLSKCEHKDSAAPTAELLTEIIGVPVGRGSAAKNASGRGGRSAPQAPPQEQGLWFLRRKSSDNGSERQRERDSREAAGRAEQARPAAREVLAVAGTRGGGAELAHGGQQRAAGGGGRAAGGVALKQGARGGKEEQPPPQFRQIEAVEVETFSGNRVRRREAAVPGADPQVKGDGSSVGGNGGGGGGGGSGDGASEDEEEENDDEADYADDPEGPEGEGGSPPVWQGSLPKRWQPTHLKERTRAVLGALVVLAGAQIAGGAYVAHRVIPESTLLKLFSILPGLCVFWAAKAVWAFQGKALAELARGLADTPEEVNGRLTALQGVLLRRVAVVEGIAILLGQLGAAFMRRAYTNYGYV